MVRGHAKAVSQAKNQAKLADKAASVKRDGAEVYLCLVFLLLMLCACVMKLGSNRDIFLLSSESPN
jgi:hypothetical protein